MTTAAAPLSLAVALFGTEEAVPEAVTLRAGPLEASLDAGNLRHGREAVRGIGFVARDRGRGTCVPAMTGLAESDDRRGVRALAVATPAGIVARLSNLTGRPRRIRVDGAPSAGRTSTRRLDAGHLRASLPRSRGVGGDGGGGLARPDRARALRRGPAGPARLSAAGSAAAPGDRRKNAVGPTFRLEVPVGGCLIKKRSVDPLLNQWLRSGGRGPCRSRCVFDGSLAGRCDLSHNGRGGSGLSSRPSPPPAVSAAPGSRDLPYAAVPRPTPPAG